MSVSMMYVFFSWNSSKTCHKARGHQCSQSRLTDTNYHISSTEWAHYSWWPCGESGNKHHSAAPCNGFNSQCVDPNLHAPWTAGMQYERPVTLMWSRDAPCFVSIFLSHIWRATAWQVNIWTSQLRFWSNLIETISLLWNIFQLQENFIPLDTN
jgi:hypothetical protein